MEKLSFYKKPVMIDFVNLNGVEVNVSELLSVVSDLEETEVDDRYGDYSLRNYETNAEIADILVDMGIVRKYVGSRMATLYCKADETSLEKLREEICDYLEK